jgi:hypothetical protein
MKADDGYPLLSGGERAAHSRPGDEPNKNVAIVTKSTLSDIRYGGIGSTRERS